MTVITDTQEIVRLKMENASVKKPSGEPLIVLLALMDITITQIASRAIVSQMEQCKFKNISKSLLNLIREDTWPFKRPNMFGLIYLIA